MRRRNFLKGMLAAPVLRAQELPSASGSGRGRKKLAAVVAAYSMQSDADNLITRFLEGYWIDNTHYEPPCDIASVCVDRIDDVDIGRRLSAAYGFAVASSIPDALTMGTGTLAVDGVILVGERNGKSPFNDAAPQRDLRLEFLEQTVGVFRKSGRSVPVFCSGYLSENREHAAQMYDWSREAGFPLMAGSPAAVTFRRPELEYPLPGGFDDAPLGDRAHHDDLLGVDFEDALVLTAGASADAMFAGLEILQAFMERRRKGESGIRSVECLIGEAAWRAAEAGRWSKDLMQAALGRRERLGTSHPETAERPTICLIEYNDGAHGAVLSLGEQVREYLAAFRVRGRREIDSTLCYTPIGSRNDFSMLAHGIAQMMLAGASPYPVERTLLASGALSFLRQSALQGKPIETPVMKITYAAPVHSFYARGRGW